MKLLLALLLAAASGKHEWLGSEMPLPLAVRTPQDLEFKSVAEREYLIFNLLTSGKVAWDAGDFATAAAKWESLLAVPDLEPSIDKVVRPFALEARRARAARWCRCGGRTAPCRSLCPPARWCSSAGRRSCRGCWRSARAAR